MSHGSLRSSRSDSSSAATSSSTSETFDELRTLVGFKGGVVWVWLVVSHLTGQIQALQVGGRGAASLRALWKQRPPQGAFSVIMTDQYPVYQGVFEELGLQEKHWPCAKGKGETNVVEGVNCALRHGVSLPHSPRLYLCALVDLS